MITDQVVPHGRLVNEILSGFAWLDHQEGGGPALAWPVNGMMTSMALSLLGGLCMHAEGLNSPHASLKVISLVYRLNSEKAKGSWIDMHGLLVHNHRDLMLLKSTTRCDVLPCNGAHYYMIPALHPLASNTTGPSLELLEGINTMDLTTAGGANGTGAPDDPYLLGELSLLGVTREGDERG